MTYDKDQKHGGKREGAGRPKAPESVVIRLRVAPDVAEAVQARGGAIWLKRVIQEAIEVQKR